VTGEGPTVVLEWLDLPAPGRKAPAGGRVAIVSLNRPSVANAFNDAVITDALAALNEASTRSDVRALVLRGRGKHFSGGADLSWMRASGALSEEANRKDSERLIHLFEAVAQFRVPTLAVVTGSAFGGAVGLTAACDVAIATTTARFSLSEVKLGIAPAVIWPYLTRRMSSGALTRLALTGKLFDAEEARAAGLLQRVVPEAELQAAVREELNGFLQGSPEAQGALKRLAARVAAEGGRQGSHTAATIAALRAGPSGQDGLKAFFAKTPAPWSTAVPEDFRLPE
jgi:methylglutaconyl-CoA hydratase